MTAFANLTIWLKSVFKWARQYLQRLQMTAGNTGLCTPWNIRAKLRPVKLFSGYREIIVCISEMIISSIDGFGSGSDPLSQYLAISFDWKYLRTIIFNRSDRSLFGSTAAQAKDEFTATEVRPRNTFSNCKCSRSLMKDWIEIRSWLNCK